MAMEVKRTIAICLTMLIVSLLSSCVPKNKIILYNNTKCTINVYIVQLMKGEEEVDKYTIYPDTTKGIHYPPVNRKMIVHTDSNIWSYDRIDIDNVNEGYYYTGKIYIQIESNGLIYIAKKSNRFPLKLPISQPDGFPLVPIIDRKV